MWIDYDLTSAYTTVMSILGTPDYKKAWYLTTKEFEKLSDESLLFNYMTLELEFKFPSRIKYPCIPTRVDDNSDIYPLEGRSVLTGPEFLVARNMGCAFNFIEGVIIPFKGGVNPDSKQESKGGTS